MRQGTKQVQCQQRGCGLNPAELRRRLERWRKSATEKGGGVAKDCAKLEQLIQVGAAERACGYFFAAAWRLRRRSTQVGKPMPRPISTTSMAKISGARSGAVTFFGGSLK